MDKLFEFLTSKIGYTIAIILGFLFPGMLFIFVWNREVYFDIGLVRLIILALCISFAIFLCNLLTLSFSFSAQEKAGDKEKPLDIIFVIPMIISNLEIYLALLYKLENSEFTIIQFINDIIIVAIALGAIGSVPSYIKLLCKRIKKPKK